MNSPFSWAELLTDFAPIPELIGALPPERMSHQIVDIAGNPVYLLLEQLVTDLTIVYSPPKVGGSTITATLARHPAITREPEHIHYLSREGIDFVDQQIRNTTFAECAFQWRSQLARCRWARMMVNINRSLRAAGASVRKPFLIAGVREPISHYLSTSFEFWWMFTQSQESITAESLKARLPHDPFRQRCAEWFTDELEAVFGIDVFARPFPTERGWDLYENDDARVLVIRQENLNQLPEALAALHGFDAASVIPEDRNKADAKDYAELYNAVKRQLRLTDAELDGAYSHRYVRHFYSQTEIDSFRKRWREGSSRPTTSRTEPTPTKATPKPQPAPTCTHTTTSRAAGHPRACRPCPECAAQLQSIPVLRQACDERLALIEQLDTRLRRRASLSGKLRSLLGRLRRRTPAA